MLSRGWLGLAAMPRFLPVPSARTKQGSLAPTGCVVPPFVATYDPIRRPSGSARLPVWRLYAPAAPGPQCPGPGRASPVPATAFRTFHAPYGGGFLGAALPGSSRLPWPSPWYSGLGSPLSLSGWSYAAAGFAWMLRTARLLPPTRLSTLGFNARRFPLTSPACYQAPWRLPGAGLAPAGGDELTGYALSDHPAHLHPVLARVPSGHAVIAPASEHRVELRHQVPDGPLQPGSWGRDLLDLGPNTCHGAA